MPQTTLDQRMLGVGTALTDHTITASDVLTFNDTDGSNKRDTVQGVLDLSSSDWVLISTVTADGDTFSDFATLDHTTYSSYQFVIEFTVDTDASHVDMLLAVSGTTYLEGTNYSYIDSGIQRTAGSLSVNPNPNMAFIRFGSLTGDGNAADEGFGGVVDCHFFGSASRHALVNCAYSRMDNSTTSNLCWGTTSAALLGSTAAITAVRFKASSGTHTGKIKMYGRK